MIEKLNITNFGSFKEFKWDLNVHKLPGEVVKFKKLNILYGRNYSGKTTISRILRSLETGILPPKYESPDFDVVAESSSTSHTQIPSSDIAIRTYNRDFVNENLRFLSDEEGVITPFAIVGGENNEIERSIEAKELQLGSVESKSGSQYDLSIIDSKHRVAKEAFDTSRQLLEKKLRNKATRAGSGMKHNAQDFGDANYNLPKIKCDIAEVIRNPKLLLNEHEKDKREKFVKETSLPDVHCLQFEPSIAGLHSKAVALIGKQVKPSDAIEELLSDATLQAWVKDGIPLHRESRKTCGFCKSKLPDRFWEKIDNHFNEASKQLDASIKKHIAEIQSNIDKAEEFEGAIERSIYADYRVSFNEAKLDLENELKAYMLSLQSINRSLQEKSDDLFGAQSLPALTYDCKELTKKIENVNKVIRANNEKTDSLTADQKQARKELRLSEVASFVTDIGYEDEANKIEQLETKMNSVFEEFQVSKMLVQETKDQIDQLRVQLHDESKGADKVNEILARYFGHDSLRLVAETGEVGESDSNSASKFKIMRGDSTAFNLSEGECSLVAFCYFIAKLDLDSDPGNLTIFIDDPISSLDSNHVFFIYSLIESLIASPRVNSNGEIALGDNGKPVYRYGQLFISTHNLEFLKYLKRLSRPKKNHEQFLILGESDGSKIKLMPDYLKLYITEFNYLFAEICKCADAAITSNEHHCFYNFGNNLRKFLEAFLFFKYPFASREGEDHNKRVVEFFGGDSCDAVLVQRLTNELSHLGGSFDRSAEPIDYAEITQLAKYVLEKIKSNDARQYQCLLDSVELSDPLLTV